MNVVKIFFSSVKLQFYLILLKICACLKLSKNQNIKNMFICLGKTFRCSLSISFPYSEETNNFWRYVKQSIFWVKWDERTRWRSKNPNVMSLNWIAGGVDSAFFFHHVGKWGKTKFQMEKKGRKLSGVKLSSEFFFWGDGKTLHVEEPVWWFF